MVTMSYLLEDQQQLRNMAQLAFNRRKQLCPFTLTYEELLDVIYRPDVAAAIRFLRTEQPKALHWDNMAQLHLPAEDHPAGELVVFINTKSTFPLACDPRGPKEIYSHHANQSAAQVVCAGPLLPALKEWAWKATQIELENRWALGIITQLVHTATTHQQIHRYMPEIYTLLVSEEDVRIPKGTWGRRRFNEVWVALKEIGSARAQKIELEDVNPRMRANFKALVSQCLILKAHDGLKSKDEFDDTWINHPTTIKLR